MSGPGAKQAQSSHCPQTKTHFCGVLKREVAQTADPLDRDRITRSQPGVAQGVAFGGEKLFMLFGLGAPTYPARRWMPSD